MSRKKISGFAYVEEKEEKKNILWEDLKNNEAFTTINEGSLRIKVSKDKYVFFNDRTNQLELCDIHYLNDDLCSWDGANKIEIILRKL